MKAEIAALRSETCYRISRRCQPQEKQLAVYLREEPRREQ